MTLSLQKRRLIDPMQNTSINNKNFAGGMPASNAGQTDDKGDMSIFIIEAKIRGQNGTDTGSGLNIAGFGGAGEKRPMPIQPPSSDGAGTVANASIFTMAKNTTQNTATQDALQPTEQSSKNHSAKNKSEEAQKTLKQLHELTKSILNLTA